MVHECIYILFQCKLKRASNLLYMCRDRKVSLLHHAILINLQLEGGPPSKEQVAKSTGPLDDEQFRVSTLANGTGSHCSSTIGGTVRE